MKVSKLLLLAIASIMFCSCSNVLSLMSLGIKTFDFEKVDDDEMDDRIRTVKTKYSFVAYELDVVDSSVVAAGKTVKILAQEAPDFTNVTFKKPTRLLAYRPDVRFLLELPDGKRVWGVLPEASIGLKAYCLETKDTVVVTDVIRYSKAVPNSRCRYMFVAGSKKYTFEELGWGLKDQVYYYQHHLIKTENKSDNKWLVALSDWMDRNPFNKIFTQTDSFYQYPRFSFMNTRWMPNIWHIVFMVVGFIIVFFLYLLLLYVIFDTLFCFIMRWTVFRIKLFGNGTVSFFSHLLLLAFALSIIYFLGMIDLFIVVFFFLAWGSISMDVEMTRCPYCHSVGKMEILERSDMRSSVSFSDSASRNVEVGQKHSSYTEHDGTVVNVTTHLMERQSFRDRIVHRRWKENYFCTACNRKITYNKHESESTEVRVG